MLLEKMEQEEQQEEDTKVRFPLVYYCSFSLQKLRDTSESRWMMPSFLIIRVIRLTKTPDSRWFFFKLFHENNIHRFESNQKRFFNLFLSQSPSHRGKRQQQELITELRRRQGKDNRHVYEGKDGAIEDIITGKRVIITANLIHNCKHELLINHVTKAQHHWDHCIVSVEHHTLAGRHISLQEKLTNHRS